MKKNTKHDKCINDVVDLMWKKPWVEHIETNIEYPLNGSPKGEVDVLVKSYDHELWYIEVKSNDRPKARRKARDQVNRWIKYMSDFTDHQLVGAYYSPQSGLEVMKSRYGGKYEIRR